MPLRLVLALILFGVANGCASFRPQPVQEAGFLERVQTESQGGVRVTVAVPSAKESRAVFGVPLARYEIQPVWVRVENREDVEYVFLPASMDPDYFSPQEVAWKSRRGFSSQGKWDMQVYFHDTRMRLSIPPGKSVEGFVHTNLDYGVKFLNVVLYHPGRTKQFEFVVEIGVRLSSKTITTHQIDPQVDETRDYLVQDMLLSGSMEGLGYVGGVGPASPDEPRTNYTLDPYFTDGLCAVITLADGYHSEDDVEFLDWEWPEID